MNKHGYYSTPEIPSKYSTLNFQVLFMKSSMRVVDGHSEKKGKIWNCTLE